MKTVEVHAGWLKTQSLIGRCYIDKARGKEIISFSYDPLWLSLHPDLVLDPELIMTDSRQYPPDGKACFGFLSDAAPDRWGRKLMERIEGFDSSKEGRSRRTLTESDYILGVHDKGRIGGLRFYDPASNMYLSYRDSLAAPPMKRLREIEHDAFMLSGKDLTDEEKWTRNLIDPGSSLGGARPKANILDENGNIWIAKFPAKDDTSDVGAWEMVAHDLASECGINTPDAMLMRLSDSGSTFLSKRFDRDKDKRIHYASAMTMLGATDTDHEGFGYVDIASMIEEISATPEEDLKELWRRMVFNICISDNDDHLRNHGLILGKTGWHLSPAFDVNPEPEKAGRGLDIGDGSRRDLESAYACAGLFRTGDAEAKKQIQKTRSTIAGRWGDLASKYGISKAEQKRISHIFAIV